MQLTASARATCTDTFTPLACCTLDTLKCMICLGNPLVIIQGFLRNLSATSKVRHLTCIELAYTHMAVPGARLERVG